MKSLFQYIFEGSFDWFKEIFERTNKFQEAYKKRNNGKLPELKIDDISKLQVSKPLTGDFDNETAKNIEASGFALFNKIYNKRKEYFSDNDGGSMKLESLVYIYTPENPLSADEKYIMGLAIKADKEFIKDYMHIVDFEVSSQISNGKNISSKLFETYVDTIKGNKKGITMRYINNLNDFPFTYKGKKFTVAEADKNIIKIKF